MEVSTRNVSTSNVLTTSEFELSVDQASIDQFRIGQGINTITGERGGYIVQYDSAAEELDTIIISPGTGTKAVIHVIESYEELKRRMNLSISASLGLGAFRSNTYAEFVRQSEISSYSKYIYIDVISKNISQILKRLRATDEAIQRAQTSSQDFFQYAGNRFVAGVQSGARLTAIIEIKANNLRQFENNSGSINVSVNLLNSGTITFQECLSRLSTFRETRSFVLRLGGNRSLPDFNSVISYANSIPELARNSPWPMALILNSYDTVENLPDNIINQNELDRQAVKLGEVEQCLNKFYQYRSDLLDVRKRPTRFDYPGDLSGNVEASLNDVQEVISSCTSKAREISRNPTVEFEGCPALPLLTPKPTLKNVIPVQVFDDINYGGFEARYDTSVSFVGGQLHDKISSIKVGEGYKAIFYWDADFAGFNFELIGPASIPSLVNHHQGLPFPLPGFHWSDKISSIRIIEL